MQNGGNPAKPNLKTRASSQGNFPLLAPRRGFHSGSINKTARGIWDLSILFCSQKKTWATPGSLACRQAFPWNLVLHKLFAVGQTLFLAATPQSQGELTPCLPSSLPDHFSALHLAFGQPLHGHHSHWLLLSCQNPNTVSRPFLLALCKHSDHLALWRPPSLNSPSWGFCQTTAPWFSSPWDQHSGYWLLSLSLWLCS